MRYKISRYNYKAWQIEEWVVPETGKRAGQGKWVARWYPGSLEATAHALLDLAAEGAESDVDAEGVRTLIQRIKHSVEAILDGLERAGVEPGSAIVLTVGEMAENGREVTK